MERMIPLQKLWATFSPFSLNKILTARHALSSFGFNEHKLEESMCGSIGSTVSGKYTEFPFKRAAMSSGLSGVT